MKEQIIEILRSYSEKWTGENYISGDDFDDIADEITDHLTAEQGDGYDNYKKVAVEFFYWWWNKGGTNTDDGFDEWAKREESKKLLKSPELTVREVVEWMKNNKKWLKVHSTGEVESNIASGHFISEDELTKIIRP